MYCKEWFFKKFIQDYRKGVSSRMSQLVAQPGSFRMFMKPKFDAYVLWPLAKSVQNWIVDRPTARNFMVTILDTPKKKFTNWIDLTQYNFLWNQGGYRDESKTKWLLALPVDKSNLDCTSTARTISIVDLVYSWQLFPNNLCKQSI